MDKIKFSKTDSRRTVMALAVVAMFLATIGVGNVDAAASPVSLEADKSGAQTIMVDQELDVTLTLDSSDTRYRKMDVYMVSNWPGGTAWTSYFLDTNGDELSNGQITLTKGGTATVIFKIICDGVCAAGDTNSVNIYGNCLLYTSDAADE